MDVERFTVLLRVSFRHIKEKLFKALSLARWNRGREIVEKVVNGSSWPKMHPKTDELWRLPS